MKKIIFQWGFSCKTCKNSYEFLAPQDKILARFLALAENTTTGEYLLECDSGHLTLVNFSLNLRNILSVDEKASLLSLEISLRMFWKDHRVKATGLSQNEEYVVISPSAFQQFWIPGKDFTGSNFLSCSIYSWVVL